MFKDIRYSWNVLKNGAERNIMQKYSHTGQLTTISLLRMDVTKRSKTCGQPMMSRVHVLYIISFQYFIITSELNELLVIQIDFNRFLLQIIVNNN